MRLWSRAGWLLVNVFACSAALAGVEGQPVSAVLEGLRAQGLTFIYNTEILPAGLRVEAEPSAQAGLALAEEVLASHGLELLPIAPGIYSVVSARSAAIPSTNNAAAEEPIEEVVVQTSRYTLANETATPATFLNQQQLKSLPRFADEPLRALQRLPGISTNGFSSLGSVRGGLTNETSIVLDGLRLYEPFHLKNFLAPVSLLDSQVIDSIEFYSGGFPSIYGDSLSSVVDARTVHPSQPRYFELGADVFHSSGLASVQLGDNARALVAARRSNLREIADLGERDFGDIEYSDGLARLEYQLDAATKGSVQTLLAEDEIVGKRAAGTQEVRARYRNLYAWATLDHQWSASASSRVIASFTTLTNERRGILDDPGERTGWVRDERSFDIAGLRIDNQLQTGFVQQRFGAELRDLQGRYDYTSALTLEPMFPFPGSSGVESTRSSQLQPSGFESAVYWDGLANLDTHWIVQGGVRGELQSYAGSGHDTQLSPRLSVLYRATAQTQLRASWGRFFQSQGINELQVEDGIETRHAPQYADHTIVALEHAFPAGFNLRLEAYRKEYREISPRFENLFNSLVLLPEVEFDRVRIDAQRARATGIELLLQVQPHGAWSGWLNYSWARAADKIDGRYVPRSSEQRQSANLGAVWSTRGWTITLADSFHTGTPTTPFALSMQANGPAINTARRNSDRLAHYNSLDLRIAHELTVARGNLEVFFELNNALNRRNPYSVEYSASQTSASAVEVSRDVKSLLPRVPSLGVMWRFE